MPSKRFLKGFVLFVVSEFKIALNGQDSDITYQWPQRSNCDIFKGMLHKQIILKLIKQYDMFSLKLLMQKITLFKCVGIIPI